MMAGTCQYLQILFNIIDFYGLKSYRIRLTYMYQFFCSYVYKLSDFGTAKPLKDGDFFQSLVGTEEYLVKIMSMRAAKNTFCS